MFAIFKKFTPISAALLPNAESDDIWLVLKMFLPWNWNKWNNGKEIDNLKNKFKEYFNVKYAISFSSGRVGFYAILRSCSDSGYNTDKIQPGEIITQAYTTIAIPIMIKQAGFIPVYADISENTYNIDPDKIEEKITKNTRAIIVQHTFGIPAEMNKILKICQKHNLILIEDCAHSLGAEYNGKKIGTFGSAAFFSFGRDKIISSTSGGMVITDDPLMAKKINEYQCGLRVPPINWTIQQLFHTLVFGFSLPVYYFFNIGKLKIFFNQKLGIISRAYSRQEKRGDMIYFDGYKFPNVLAILALNQLKKLERFNNHRRKIAEIYNKSFSALNSGKRSKIMLPEIILHAKPTYLYYTIQIGYRDELLKFAAKKHIILGDWFPGALGPKGINEAKFSYKKGDCPIAEYVGLRSLNLPTNIKTSEEDALNVFEIIQGYLEVNKK